MSRATSLADLYRASVQEYTRTPAEWKDLLSCVARFYKRSFDNAVLIYAQKPDATQMGTFDEWHDRRVGRSINRGAKSIAVIDMVNPNASIKYLFDFMDTNGSVQSYRNLQQLLWELEEQYRPSILMRFHERYSTPTSSMEACLYHLVRRRTREWLAPYMESFRIMDEASPLHGMPEGAVKAEFMKLVEESVAYTVFSKCGIPTEMFGDDSFENISSYNTLQLFIALGSCTVSIARPILNEINREIQEIKIERSRIYENRAIDELHIQTGRGRDAVSRDQGIGGPTGRPDAGGAVREPVESVHDGGAPLQAVGTGGTGQDQRNDSADRPGGGAEERSADSGTAGRPPHAGHGGRHGEGRTHGHDNERGGRDSDGRGSTESKIIPTAKFSSNKTEPPADGFKPSVGGFFVVPPKTQETVQVPQAEAGVPSGQLGEEEISRLMDMVLCADDLIPDARVWHSEICGFFQRGNSQEKKADALKLIYGELDEDYTIQDGGGQMHVLGQDGGIVFQADGGNRFYSYLELSKRIDAMILDGTYPFSAEEEKLDGPTIPDGEEEPEESRSGSGSIAGDAVERQEDLGQPQAGQKDLYGQEKPEAGREAEEPEEDRQAQKKGPTTKGEQAQEEPTETELRYIHAVLRDQSRSLYLQKTIQEYFSGHPDKGEREAFVKKAYSTGHRKLEEGGVLVKAGTWWDGMHIRAYEQAGAKEIHLSWEQVTAHISYLAASGTYVNPDAPGPPGRQEVIDHFLTESGSGYEGGKQRIYRAMTSILSAKERIKRLKHEYGTGGRSANLENGGSYDIDFNSKGFRIEYAHDGVEVRELLTWERVEERIRELIGRDAYLSAEEKAELERLEEVHYAPGETEVPEEASARQFSLFDLGMESGYEDNTGSGQDAMLDADKVQGPPHPFPEGERICYSEERHLYDGGSKAKLQNNVAAIRLPKELEGQGRGAGAEEQAALAERFEPVAIKRYGQEEEDGMER